MLKNIISPDSRKNTAETAEVKKGKNPQDGNETSANSTKPRRRLPENFRQGDDHQLSPDDNEIRRTKRYLPEGRASKKAQLIH